MALEEVFKAGRFTVEILDIEDQFAVKNILEYIKPHGSSTKAPPPKPLRLAHPTESGDYPVVLLFHGFMIPNSAYTQLLRHIASHGYITIAPQMYVLTGEDATTEIDDAVAISDWLPDGLSFHLPDDVRPDFQNVAISGHSRGGKVAFGLAQALGRTSKKTKVKLSALVGIDPVDGRSRSHQSKPPILTHKPHSFDLHIPTLVIGSGLGEKGSLLAGLDLGEMRNFTAGLLAGLGLGEMSNLEVPPFAPEGVNHRDFFVECSVPSYHFVASDFGHMDFLDDSVNNAIVAFVNIVCKKGEAREPMRRFCGGVMVAFLNASLRNDSGAFNDLLVNPSDAPVILEPPQSFVSKS